MRSHCLLDGHYNLINRQWRWSLQEAVELVVQIGTGANTDQPAAEPTNNGPRTLEAGLCVSARGAWTEQRRAFDGP